MNSVFLGGSRQVSRLNGDIRDRLDTIIEKGFPIIIGDANGADKALQQYLNSKGYRNVRVFCSGGRCRNNLGSWDIVAVNGGAKKATFAFYAAKDRAMAKDAHLGFMLWDGKSAGTLCNIHRLVEQQKKAALYIVPEHRFRDIKDERDFSAFIAACSAEVQTEFEEKRRVDEYARREQLTLVD